AAVRPSSFATSMTCRATRSASSSSRAPRAAAEPAPVFAALGVCGLVAAVLSADIAGPRLKRALASWRASFAAVAQEDIAAYDPGRERRAEQRARELLRSC